MTFAQLVDNNNSNRASCTTMPAQCGMRFLYHLSSNATPKEQAATLALTMGWGYDKNVGQIIFTDTLEARNTRWKAAKDVAFKGPITTNPNSDNRIQVYIVTGPMIMKIAKRKK